MKQIIIVLVGLIALPIITFGQEEKNNKQIAPAVDTSLKIPEVSFLNLEEVSLAATRFKENKKFLAQQVFTISKKSIEYYNQPTTAELLSQTGQVLVQKSQLGGGSPIIRGFEANKVLIAVDGIRMNNAIFRGGHLQNVITMDNEAMEKVELLFGPSSVMYGSDALGGVMSFYTRNPELATQKNIFTANASLRYASAISELHAHADFCVSTKKIGSFTSLTVSDFGDLQQGKKKYDAFPLWGNDSFNVQTINGRDTLIKNSDPSKQMPTAYRQYDAIQKLVFQSGAVKHTVNLQFSTSTDIPRYDRLTEISSTGIPKNSEWYYGPQQRLLAAWHLELPANRYFDQARITSAFQDILESRHNRSFGSTVLKNRNENVRVGSLNADFTKKFIKSEYNYGLELTYNKVNSKANTEDIVTGIKGPLDTRYPDGGSHTNSAAFYSSLLHKFSEKLILNGGARLSYSSLQSSFKDTGFFPFPFSEIKQSNFALTGNAGLIWLPGHQWKFSILFSKGFRTPNVDDGTKIFESTAGRLIVPNPDLKPEITFNYELGISKKIGERIMAGITAWYTDFHNILTTDSASFNGQTSVNYDGAPSRVYTIVNKNKAFLWGIGGRLDGNISQHMYFASSIQYSYGQILTSPANYPLDHIPPVFGRLALGIKEKGFNAEIFTLFNGTKDSSRYNLLGEDNQIYSADPRRGYTPSWMTLNIRTSLNINKLYSLSLSVENIMDRYYRVFASGLSAPGRNFILTLRGKF